LQAQASLGTIEVDIRGLVNATGLEVTSSLGAITANNVCNAFVQSLSAQASLGEVLVWEQINPNQTPGYSPIAPSQDPGYTQITPAPNSIWTEIAA
jgi:hypothetical protein